MKGGTYKDAGVDYGQLDLFKRLAQSAAADTSGNASRHGAEVYELGRGESCFVLKMGGVYFGFVIEGLGTKNLVADAMQKLTGQCYYAGISQDTIAMIVNDMITLGVFPVVTAMYIATGDSAWLDRDQLRAQEIVRGWKEACDACGCVWGPGETPTLKGIIDPNVIDLSGAALGRTLGRRKPINPKRIHAGAAVVFFESSGIHANGLTLARKIAEGLPEGYLTMLPGGQTYGEALLAPTHLYVSAMEALLRAGVDVHYAINITGHGWRKIMRAPEPFTYVVDELPQQQPLFNFIQEHGRVTDAEAYGNLNMGAGFAIIVPEEEVMLVHSVARNQHWPFRTFWAGRVEGGEKRVVIPPVGLEFKADTLAVR